MHILGQSTSIDLCMNLELLWIFYGVFHDVASCGIELSSSIELPKIGRTWLKQKAPWLSPIWVFCQCVYGQKTSKVDSSDCFKVRISRIGVNCFAKRPGSCPGAKLTVEEQRHWQLKPMQHLLTLATMHHDASCRFVYLATYLSQHLYWYLNIP